MDSRKSRERLTEVAGREVSWEVMSEGEEEEEDDQAVMASSLMLSKAGVPLRHEISKRDATAPTLLFHLLARIQAGRSDTHVKVPAELQV